MVDSGAQPGADWLKHRSDLDELALSQWGLWSDELDDYTLTKLAESYIRRKQVEARLLATQVAGPPVTKQKEQSPPNTTHVSLDQMFGIIGGDSFEGKK